MEHRCFDSIDLVGIKAEMDPVESAEEAVVNRKTEARQAMLAKLQGVSGTDRKEWWSRSLKIYQNETIICQ